jgi:hypothetical protein
MKKENLQDDTPAPQRHGRRQFIFGAAAAGAGLVAGLIADASPADAADDGNIKLGLGNTATATTTVTASNGAGLQGRTTANGNIGIEGIDASPGGSGYGVFGNSAKGYGVAGVSGGGTGVSGRSGDGNGVYGHSNSGHAVHGESDAGSGVYGSTQTGNYGVYGEGHGVEGNGLGGHSSGTFSSGVLGTASGPSGGCTGVGGSNVNDPSGYGVYARAEKGTALYANGNAHVTGTLSKGGGSFKIDHPLDPAHKYLYHSFVESPDMMNVYNGTVTLNHDGRATVELPDWFEALNRDFRYQLTALLGAAPDLHVSALVANGRFAIAGGKPDLKVSWQVTGIRQDGWANANRIPLEVDKPAHDQGRYLHPDLYENGNGEPIEALTVGRRHAKRVPAGGAT